jgi:hypothetical protein
MAASVFRTAAPTRPPTPLNNGASSRNLHGPAFSQGHFLCSGTDLLHPPAAGPMTSVPAASRLHRPACVKGVCFAPAFCLSQTMLSTQDSLFPHPFGRCLFIPWRSGAPMEPLHPAFLLLLLNRPTFSKTRTDPQPFPHAVFPHLSTFPRQTTTATGGINSSESVETVAIPKPAKIPLLTIGTRFPESLSAGFLNRMDCLRDVAPHGVH